MFSPQCTQVLLDFGYLFTGQKHFSEGKILKPGSTAKPFLLETADIASLCTCILAVHSPNHVFVFICNLPNATTALSPPMLHRQLLAWHAHYCILGPIYLPPAPLPFNRVQLFF